MINLSINLKRGVFTLFYGAVGVMTFNSNHTYPEASRWGSTVIWIGDWELDLAFLP